MQLLVVVKYCFPVFSSPSYSLFLVFTALSAV